jgi:hypothetical protein
MSAPMWGLGYRYPMYKSGSRNTKKGMQYSRRSDVNLTGQAILQLLLPTPCVPGRRRLRI